MNRSVEGWAHGLMGMVIFSGSLPATRVAVADLSPLFLTSGRAVVAAALAAVILAVLRPVQPARADLRAMALVAIGVVVGFPLLTALALQHISASRSIVFIGLLPLTTAFFGVLRGGERPRPMFWLFSGIGAAAVAGFALVNSGGGSLSGDLLMILAVLLCGLGYAEGAILSRRLGGWQVISWALLLSMPPMGVVALATLPASWTAIGGPAWLGFAYVSVFSMLLGFVFWYRGLALGGIARVGQLQLLQPFISLVLSAVLLREAVSWTMIATTGVVVLCVAGAKRSA